MKSKSIIIGSRGSQLALWQANYVKDLLEDLGKKSEIKIITTKGDQIQNLSFDKIEGKGFFTKEIELALLNTDIDLAVHSLKDLESESPNGLFLGAVTLREDPSDILLVNKNSLDLSNDLDLKTNAIVGTSSARRKNQLFLFREDLKIKDLRGNVPTRINKLNDGFYDAIVLAKAGINRLNPDISQYHIVNLSPTTFIPAPSQGALGLQIRNDDRDLKKLLNKINHKSSYENVMFERVVLKGIGGGCHSPMGAYSFKDQNGKRNTWVSYSDHVNQTPIRFYTNSNNADEVVDKVKKNTEGKKIWISRELTNESIFKKILKNANCIITPQSLIKKSIVEIIKIPQCEWVFFNSAFCYDSIKNFKTELSKKKIAAFGNSTSKYLKKQGLKIDFEGEGSPENVARSFKSVININEVVFFPLSDRSIGTVQKMLSKDNKVIFQTYNTELKEKKIELHDYYVFTSPSNVEAFFKSNSLKSLKAVSIGPSTTSSLRKKGVNNIVEAFESSELALADVVISLL